MLRTFCLKVKLRHIHGHVAAGSTISSFLKMKTCLIWMPSSNPTNSPRFKGPHLFACDPLQLRTCGSHASCLRDLWLFPKGFLWPLELVQPTKDRLEGWGNTALRNYSPGSMHVTGPLRAGALGWPWGMGWGRRWEGRSGWGHMCTRGWFMSMYGKTTALFN